MRKIYTILFVLVCQNAFAQYYTQYFDGSDTAYYNSILVELDTSTENIWQIGKPQKIIFDTAATMPNAIVTDTINSYPINNTSRFFAKNFNNFGFWGIYALQWKQKLDLDFGKDGGIVEYSTDSGKTWVSVFNNPYVYNFYGYDSLNIDTLDNGEYAFTGTDTTWRDIWLCFDISWTDFFAYNDTLMFRFSLLSDSIDNHKEGWMIDNMMAHITFIHTIKDINMNTYLSVYPNPSSNRVYIQAEKRNEFHIIENMKLIGPSGQTIQEWSNIPTKFWFDTKEYPDGLYYLKVKTNIKTETIPLLLNK